MGKTIKCVGKYVLSGFQGIKGTIRLARDPKSE
jgi:hypothetical protein